MRSKLVIKLLLASSFLVLLFSNLSLNAKELCVRPNMERELPYFAKEAESIVIAEYTGYSILRLDEQKFQELRPNFPVRANYKTVKVMKGPALPALISVKSNYHFEHVNASFKGMKVSDWSEPTKGSKWILYLKSVEPKLLASEGYKPIIGNYTFGLEYSQNNVERTLKSMKK